MIIQAACRKDGKVYVGRRHHNIINRDTPELKQLPWGYFRTSEQGFVDDKGNFLTREEAAKHAMECGQVTPGKANVINVFNGETLYSEDLY